MIQFAIFSIFVTSIFFYFYNVYIRARHAFKKVENIPSPKALPLVGTAYYTLKDVDKLFETERQNAKKFYPIYMKWTFNIISVVILSCADAETLLSSVKYIDKGRIYKFFHPWLGTGLLTSTGTKWQSRRKLLTPAFHWNILQEFLEVFNRETVKLVQTIGEKTNESATSINPLLFQFTLDSIKETAMGYKSESSSMDNIEYKQAILKVSNLVIQRFFKVWYYIEWIYNFSSDGKQFTESVKSLHKYTNNIIYKRKQTFLDNNNQTNYSQRKRMALLDLLLTAQKNGSDIDDIGISEEVNTFMFEGHDTTAVALTYIFLSLANNPDVQEKVYQEIVDILGNDKPTLESLQKLTYTEMCLKECLRLYPSVPLIQRSILEDVKLPSGHTLPKGSIATISFYDMHRNPDVFPDPEKFDPERFLPENTRNRHPFAYIPFSAGPRNCIGQKFAMLELKAVLCGVLRNFELKPIDKPEDMIFIADIILRTKNDIRVKFAPRLVK